MDKDGQPVVAIIGGVGSYQRGMELWNPRIKTVELLWDVIPPEEGGTQGLQSGRIVILNGGRQFILYGGWQGTSAQNGIWKYTSVCNTWQRYPYLGMNIY